MTQTSKDNSLRKVAILVASLDDASAERLLASLPPMQARAVRLQVDELAEIDPDEQREIVSDFRRSFVHSSESMTAGVELEASLWERIDHQDYAMTAAPEPRGPLDDLSTEDVDTIATMLAGESPQTVAVLLSRLESERAAEVLNKFSVAEQHIILGRLADLDTTDEQALRVVEAQVSQWICTQRQRRERMAAGRKMVEQLMSHKPSDSEAVAMAGRMARATRAVVDEYPQVAARRSVLPTPARYEPIAAAVAPPATPVNPHSQWTAAECITRLESLSDQTLLESLSRCESRIAVLALVGVSERLLKRVTRGLSRRENRLFRQQLRDIGPTRLSEILNAQQEVLRVATTSLEPS